MKKIVLIIAIVLAFYTSALADCKLDAATAARCNHEHVAGVEISKSVHHDPLDSGDPATRTGKSKDVHHKCTDGCKLNLNEGS